MREIAAVTYDTPRNYAFPVWAHYLVSLIFNIFPDKKIV